MEPGVIVVVVVVVATIRWVKSLFKKRSGRVHVRRPAPSSQASPRRVSPRRSAPQVAPAPSAKARQQRKPVQRPAPQAALASSNQVAPRKAPARRKASTRRPVPQAAPAPNSHAAPRSAPARFPDLPKPEQHWARISWQRTVITGKAYVIDGDTIRVSRRTIRLSGLDAPELDQVAKHEDGYWYKQGQRVKSELMRVIAGKHVQVQVEGTDKYGRVLGTVLYEDKDVGEWLVRKGYAIAAYGEQYKHVEREARRARRGMWAHAEVHDPRAWRHR